VRRSDMPVLVMILACGTLRQSFQPRGCTVNIHLRISKVGLRSGGLQVSLRDLSVVGFLV
jgi:hypothetical protein